MIRIICFLLLASPIFGQNIDTTQTFTLGEYLRWVREYHPVMKQASLLGNRADASLLESRGVFDPKWYGDYEDKSFDRSNYFRVGDAGLKIPLWFGADIKASYLWSSGTYLNPEFNLPTAGQALLGIEIPVLQGLLFDQRRAEVQQARMLKDVNDNVRRDIVNELLIKAIETYWEWAYYYQVVEIYQNSLTLAEDRFRLIKESFIQGDKPAIDTLESMIQIQDRSIQLADAKVNLQKANLALSNFLWYEDLVPLELSDQLTPERVNEAELPVPEVLTTERLNIFASNHPSIRALIFKQRQLEIKERLKREMFKPNIRFNYNFLGDGFNFTPATSDGNGSMFNNLVTENYKWGVTLSYPLFLRKERGGLELVRIEQLETQYKYSGKELEVTNKIRALNQQLQTLLGQRITFEDMVDNYRKLLAGENEKFRIGESSIFLINSREQKLIDAQIKQNKLQAELQKQRWKLEWAKGTLQ